MRRAKKGRAEEAEVHADIDSRGICARSTRLGNLNVCTTLWQTYREIYASQSIYLANTSIRPKDEAGKRANCLNES